MARKIDWPQLWEEFNKWQDDKRECPTCKRHTYNREKDEWEVQRRKIERLVNQRLKA